MNPRSSLLLFLLLSLLAIFWVQERSRLIWFARTPSVQQTPLHDATTHITPETEALATSSLEYVTQTSSNTAVLESAPPKETTQASPKTDDRASALKKLADELQEAKSVLEAIRIPEPKKTLIPQAELYALASERTVNFFCNTGSGEISVATGIIISNTGYILTNAHVALDTQTDRCLVRRGSPARDYVWARRVFVPKNFSIIANTYDNLRQDVSLWRINISATSEPLPASYPAFTVDPSHTTQVGYSLNTFSYPAELLSFQVISNSLYLSFSETIVDAQDQYFIQSLQGLGSQKGSSGGALVDPYTGEFAGLIFAVSESRKEDISGRKLFSLSNKAIDETVYNETGKHLYEYLATNP